MRASFTAVDSGQIPWSERRNEHVPGPIFRKDLFSDPETGMMVRLVRYPAGVINPAHTHPCGHGMYVLEGTLVTHRGEYGPGSFVWFPEGEVMTHGASAARRRDRGVHHQQAVRDPLHGDNRMLRLKLRQAPRGLLKFAACLTVAVAIPARAQTTDTAEWPQFLGPDRNGISVERNLLESWPTGGPKQLWRANGGVGMSGLVISRGRVLTLVQTDGQQRLVALDAQTGQPLWQTEIAPAYANPMGDGPRATPAIAGQRVFVFSGEGILACVNLADGRRLWSHNLLEKLGGKPPDYGVACSPLVVGDLVIVTPGAPQAAVVAVDAADGKVLWKAGNDPAGYSSPALLTLADHQQVVAFMGNSVLGLTPSSGEVLWRYPYVTDFNCNIATPLAHDGRVFVSSGENHGSALLGLKESGGKVAVEEVWASQGARSVLRNEWQTSLLLEGYLYGFDNVGALVRSLISRASMLAPASEHGSNCDLARET